MVKSALFNTFNSKLNRKLLKATVLVVIGAFLFNTVLIDLVWAYAGAEAGGCLRATPIREQPAEIEALEEILPGTAATLAEVMYYPGAGEDIETAVEILEKFPNINEVIFLATSYMLPAETEYIKNYLESHKDFEILEEPANYKIPWGRTELFKTRYKKNRDITFRLHSGSVLKGGGLNIPAEEIPANIKERPTLHIQKCIGAGDSVSVKLRFCLDLIKGVRKGEILLIKNSFLPLQVLDLELIGFERLDATTVGLEEGELELRESMSALHVKDDGWRVYKRIKEYSIEELRPILEVDRGLCYLRVISQPHYDEGEKSIKRGYEKTLIPLEVVEVIERNYDKTYHSLEQLLEIIKNNIIGNIGFIPDEIRGEVEVRLEEIVTGAQLNKDSLEKVKSEILSQDFEKLAGSQPIEPDNKNSFFITDEDEVKNLSSSGRDSTLGRLFNKKPPPGTAATLLEYLFGYRMQNGKFIPNQAPPITKENAKTSKSMAGQRDGNDSLRTIQRELRVLQDVGLVEGDRTGYYLAEWLRGVDVKKIIEENPELKLSNLSEEQIKAVTARVKDRVGQEREPRRLSIKGNQGRESFEDKAKIFGGKGAWSKITEELAEKIGFKTPQTSYLTIQEVWVKFIEANQNLVNEGNRLIERDIKKSGEVSKETLDQLERMKEKFVLPEELEELINSRSAGLIGWIINRASGRREDSYIRNLAGIFISPKKRDERLVVQGIKEIFEQAIEVIWIKQNKTDRIEGIANLLTAEEGFGVVIQSFLSFDASGTAMSNLYGYSTIEAVVGDADTAVRPVQANIAQFLFRKGQGESFEYDPSFLNTPHEFRLKGQTYSVAENLEEMTEVIKKYPEIEGRFSPLTKEEAVELNRVINALEKEIKVPLDIEWGFLNGELYIIQIRPIIGDPKKALVEISPGLKERPLIAETPIARGHTPEEGFRGRMVLFGMGVGKDTVAKFEEEFEEAYIRLQSDVASAVLGTITKAKVLVDVDQGSRQAHNINLISGRIAGGEFIYVNGPILREGFEQNLNFVPHPRLEGVWISEEELTYFSDGLKGSFYLGDRAQLKDGELTERQEILQAFHERVKDIWFEPDLDIVRDILKETIFGGEMSQQEAGLVTTMIYSLNPLESIKLGLFRGDYSKDDLETVQPKIELFEEALSYPLYPHPWESRWMSEFKVVLSLKGLGEAIEQEERREEEKIIPEKYRAVFLDYVAPKILLQRKLNKTLPECEIIRMASNLDSVKFDLHKVGYNISFFYVHLQDIRVPQLIEILTEVRKRNPQARILVEGLMVQKEAFERFQAQYGKIDITVGWFNDEWLEEVIREDFHRWQKERKASAKRPEWSSKLRVLLVDDEKEYLKDMEFLFKSSFGSEEYEFFFATTYSEALQVLEENDIDAVIFDLTMPDEEDRRDSFISKLSGISEILVISGLNYDTLIERLLRDYDKEMADRADIFEKPFKLEMLESKVKNLREKQITDHKEALAKWQAAHPEEKKPVKPEKVSVLWIEDQTQHLKGIREKLSGIFGDDKEYEFVYAVDMEKAVLEMEKQKFDVVVFDLLIRFDKKYAAKYIEGLKAVKNLYAVTLGSEDIALMQLNSLLEEEKDRVEIIGKSPDFASDLYSYVNRLIPKFKQIRLEQMEDYERTLIQWQAAHPEEGQKRNFRLVVMEYLGGHEEFIKDILSKGLRIEVNYMPLDTFANLNILGDYLESVQYEVDCLSVHLGYISEIDFILEYFRKVRSKNPEARLILESGMPLEQIRDKIKAFENQFGQIRRIETALPITDLTKLYKEIAEDCQEKYGKIESPALPAKTQRERVFIINNYSGKAGYLAELIRDELGDRFEIVTMNSVPMLQRELAKNTPEIVITDMFIDGKDELDTILHLVNEKNPQARFIVTSEEAAITPTARFKDRKVIGLVEKPFYFRKVVNICGYEVLKTSIAGLARKAKDKYQEFKTALEEAVDTARETGKVSSPQALILYSELLLDHGGIVDLDGTLEVLQEKGLLDKVIIYARDEIDGKILRRLLPELGIDLEKTILKTKEELSLQPDISEVKEAEALMEFAEREGIKKGNILSLIMESAENQKALKALAAETGVRIVVLPETESPQFYSISQLIQSVIAEQEAMPVETEDIGEKEKYQNLLQVLRNL